MPTDEDSAGPMALSGAGTYLLRFSRAAARCLESNRQEQFNSLAICCLRICICPTCEQARERTGRVGKYFKVMAGSKHQDDTFSGEDHHTLWKIEGWGGPVHGSEHRRLFRGHLGRLLDATLKMSPKSNISQSNSFMFSSCIKGVTFEALFLLFWSKSSKVTRCDEKPYFLHLS